MISQWWISRAIALLAEQLLAPVRQVHFAIRQRAASACQSIGIQCWSSGTWRKCANSEKSSGSVKLALLSQISL
ncbi:hypothetical protein ACVXHA_00810 [Escherichia coli]